MNNISGYLKLPEPFNPSQYICDICHINKSNGSVWNSTEQKTEWVCSYCYYNVLNMKPICS